MRRYQDRRHQQPRASTGNIAVRPARGLHAQVARRLAQVARRFSASTTVHDGRGQRANARSLFELLLLGVMSGEAVTVECVGDDAEAAFDAIADVLGQEEVGS